MITLAAHLQPPHKHDRFTVTIKVQAVLKKVKNQHSQLGQLMINCPSWPARLHFHLLLANVKYLAKGWHWQETYVEGYKYTQSVQHLSCFVNTFLKINATTTDIKDTQETQDGELSVMLSVWHQKRKKMSELPSISGHVWIQAKSDLPQQETRTNIWLLSEVGTWWRRSPDPLPGKGRPGWTGWDERWRQNSERQWHICWQDVSQWGKVQIQSKLW